jgi:acylphosphatase
MADAGRADFVRYAVIVHGFVQGVWFRESCRRQAASLGVYGWVRNRADGTVEAHFEGPERAVAQAVAWCRSGPPAAEVTGIDVTAEEPEGALGFQVR